MNIILEIVFFFILDVSLVIFPLTISSCMLFIFFESNLIFLRETKSVLLNLEKSFANDLPNPDDAPIIKLI